MRTIFVRSLHVVHKNNPHSSWHRLEAKWATSVLTMTHLQAGLELPCKHVPLIVCAQKLSPPSAFPSSYKYTLQSGYSWLLENTNPVIVWTPDTSHILIHSTQLFLCCTHVWLYQLQEAKLKHGPHNLHRCGSHLVISHTTTTPAQATFAVHVSLYGSQVLNVSLASSSRDWLL
ncbi:hypothetical protein BaRGS_00001134 [Batillaria attramentaria]|uniref:Uncharacterized protein n=1 Tax=Batillaria attramentaria TaxID=370345 RepID=A0ABD0M5H6_9CAEN